MTRLGGPARRPSSRRDVSTGQTVKLLLLWTSASISCACPQRTSPHRSAQLLPQCRPDPTI